MRTFNVELTEDEVDLIICFMQDIVESSMGDYLDTKAFALMKDIVTKLDDLYYDDDKEER